MLAQCLTYSRTLGFVSPASSSTLSRSAVSTIENVPSVERLKRALTSVVLPGYTGAQAGYTIEDFFNSASLAPTDACLTTKRALRMSQRGPAVPSVMSVPLYQAKADFFRTLGHPARIRILELLSERDHAVHELLAEIAIEASNLSQQLAVLRRTSLVVSRRQGGSVVYSISVPEVRDLLTAARSILTGLDKGFA